MKKQLVPIILTILIILAALMIYDGLTTAPAETPATALPTYTPYPTYTVVVPTETLVPPTTVPTVTPELGFTAEIEYAENIMSILDEAILISGALGGGSKDYCGFCPMAQDNQEFFLTLDPPITLIPIHDEMTLYFEDLVLALEYSCNGQFDVSIIYLEKATAHMNNVTETVIELTSTLSP